MSLLIPLGLLGLLGIAALILIYILKPNYQQKVISSTFVWKLSIKYKKKRVPISKLRNILLIICQILIIVACALILARPVQILREKIEQSEVVLIIDSSASMRAKVDRESRFMRAVDEAEKFADEVLKKDGIVSVIMAGDEPEFLNIGNRDGENVGAMRITLENSDKLSEALELLKEDEMCGYGTADMDQAIALCATIVDVNPDAHVYFYTDSEYAYVPQGVSVINVSEDSDWNASIVNTYTQTLDNHYIFYVDVACYGRDERIDVKIEIRGANTESYDEYVEPLKYYGTVFCTGNETKTIAFSDRKPEDLEGYEANSDDVVFVSISRPISSFQSVHVSLDVMKDGIAEDNDYDIYNGLKEIVKVQYVSSMPNPFINAALDAVRSVWEERWDMRISEIRMGKTDEGGPNYSLSGFDFYIFEHVMPDVLPTDGIVVLLDPDIAPIGLDMSFGNIRTYSNGMSLAPADSHAITNYIDFNQVEITALKIVSSFDDPYKVLATCENYPALLVKDEHNSKVVVMPFSVHYSTLPTQPFLPILFTNLFEYFLPSTVSSYSVNVNDAVTVNSRSGKVEVSYNGDEIDMLENFPAVYKPQIIGSYLFKQSAFSGDENIQGKVINDYVYVRIPVEESNLYKVEESLKSPFISQTEINYFGDLVLYFAIALVALLFTEWLLQMRDNM